MRFNFYYGNPYFITGNLGFSYFTLEFTPHIKDGDYNILIRDKSIYTEGILEKDIAVYTDTCYDAEILEKEFKELGFNNTRLFYTTIDKNPRKFLYINKFYGKHYLTVYVKKEEFLEFIKGLNKISGFKTRWFASTKPVAYVIK